MTKLRAPGSIDAALSRIAGLVPDGWAGMASTVDRKERTVRNWGDPDTPESIPLECAIALDLAYIAAGGVGAPIHETYALQLNLQLQTQFGDILQLATLNAEFILEAGQAGAAVIQATAPGAPDKLKREALRESEEAATALARTIAALRRSVGMPGGPEVPP